MSSEQKEQSLREPSESGGEGRFRATAALRIVAGILVLLGLAMGGGGLWLIWLGGSFYYMACGVMLAAAGLLLAGGRMAGLWTFLGALFGTIIWSVWEAGFDWWALLPRLGLLALLALLLFVAQAHVRRTLLARFRAVGGAALGAILLGCVLHWSVGTPPADPAFDRGIATANPPKPDSAASARGGDWQHYGNDQGGTRFSPLTEITPANVHRLQVAWTYRTGASETGDYPPLEATPLKIGRNLYFCTAHNDVIALEAETGREIWRHRSGLVAKDHPYGNCRGVAYYRVPNAVGECAARIITNTVNAELLAFDADSGRLCPGFGVNGRVSLLKGMGHVERGYYFVTSAPTIVRGKIVLGGWVADGQFWGEPSGVIRAFDAVTGQFAWAFDAGRPDRATEPPEGETYTPSTPNSWAPMSADEELGLVYIPTGNTGGVDYFGAQRRPFDERYSSSTIALEADTGKVRWSFQYVHHDLWDYDVASQPSLVDLPQGEGVRKALVQATKQGQLFLLDRITGEPIADVVERPVPQRGKVSEERLSPTQPFSVGMPPITGPRLTEKMMWGLTPLDQLWCRIQYRSRRYDGPFTPPGLQWNIVYPGYSGGMNWGGVSIDQDRQILVVNSMRLANSVRLLSRDQADRLGIKPMSENSHSNIGGTVPQAHTPYAAEVQPFLSPIQVPCQQPPYGMLSAVDLRSGKLIWTRPIGSARDAGPFGLRAHIPLPMGMVQKGGALTTRSGIIFISATKDAAIRAFDINTGRKLWEASLPAGGNATPMTYRSPIDGKQFLVILSGGSAGLQSVKGDYVMAFALPDE